MLEIDSFSFTFLRLLLKNNPKIIFLHMIMEFRQKYKTYNNSTEV